MNFPRESVFTIFLLNGLLVSYTRSLKVLDLLIKVQCLVKTYQDQSFSLNHQLVVSYEKSVTSKLPLSRFPKTCE